MTGREAPRLGAVILAAGQSKRFASATPKVLHPLLGKPLLGHVLDALRELHRGSRLGSVIVVVPPGKLVEPVVSALRMPFPVSFAVQRKPLGTGDAVRLALDAVPGLAEVLVLAGDAPLVRAETLAELVRERRSLGVAAAVLTAELPDPADYGRIIRDDDGHVVRIVEAKDATIAERHVREVNTSTYAFSRPPLAAALPAIGRENAAAEHYLTDAVRLLVERGLGVLGVRGAPEEALGANTRKGYALVGRLMRHRVLERLMDAGVTIVDPESTFVDVDVTVGAETILLPLTFLEGATRVGAGCEIGPDVRLVDTQVGDGATVTFAVARSAKIGPEAQVGPYASLRPGTVLRRKAKAGTFVEMKEADIGEGTKVPHLAYMGDVRIGRGSNVGAGTITCNYDGVAKHRTVIGDEVFIGTNNSLRAPLRIGRGAYTGAGSVVTRDVRPGETVYGVPARRQPAANRTPGGTRGRGGKSGRSGESSGGGKRSGGGNRKRGA